ncbi:hypothetical protein QDY71_08950 [Kingella negevensis]|nr:hypothetical protein [Kingella negevensis]MDK4697870.1 hypothetical protein [Kingella negevensis]
MSIRIHYFPFRQPEKSKPRILRAKKLSGSLKTCKKQMNSVSFAQFVA